MAQGFVDFGKSAVDLFGSGGAAIGDLVETIRTGKVTTRNQDDFRKRLYDTNSLKDASAKGLGTALNGVQTVLDYIPGINVLTRNPLGNAAQGALGGLADEFKTYGENYDLGRAGQRAAVSAAGAAASGSLADALKGSSNALLSSNTLQGLTRGATGGAITGGGYAAIDGGDIAQSALQGAGMGALIGGTTGAFQDFKPAKTYDVALTDDERAARIANAQKQIDDIGPIRRFTDDPNELAKRARVNELQDAIKAYQSGYDTLQDYNDALAARRANRQPSLTREEYEAKMQQRIRDLGGNYEVTPEKQAQFDRLQKVNPMRDDYHTGIRAPQDIATLQEAINNAKDIDPAYKAMLQKALADDSVTVYSSYPIEEGVFTTPIKQMAQDYAGPGNQVYSKTISPNDIAWIDDQEGNYIPRLQQLETTLSDADMAVNNPRYLTDENGNPRTFYHGSPNKNITEFDINQAGKNTSSGERALYFTDSPEVADEFSYERLPSDSMFVNNRGAKGRVYPVNLEMNNPLDLDNLTDAQIRELWQYASPLGQLDGQEKFIKNLTEFRDAAHNGQLTKTLLDLDKLKNSPYDGFTARMYPNQDNQAREYAVFDNSKVKMLEDVLAKDDMSVNSAKPAPERYIDSAGEEVPQALADYFKDASPLVRDENGNLIRFYHGTPNGSFDSPAGGSYFTPNREYADVYQSPNASSISFGKKATNPATYETYLDLRKPFDISDPEARRIYIDEYVKGGNATGINPYQSNYDDVKNIDWTEVEGLKEFLEGTGYGYDSIIADEGGVPDGNGGVVSRGKSYIPFESSQVFTLKKNLAQPMEAPVVAAAEGEGSLGAVDMSGAGENSKYFMDKYGDAIAKAGAGDDPEAMAALMMKRGNKDMVRDAFTTQQDSANGTDMYRVFREYGGSKPAARETLANALTGASANPPELVGYHGVDSEKLKKAINNFGGDIINPSLQVVNPEVNPGVKYGDVILLGNKDMYFNQGKYGLIDDTGKTNAYSRDVYSPRVPDFEEKNGNRYIAGTRTPYTAENVSKYMNKQGVKSVESTWTTPGSVAATQSHRFNNLSDILDYADQLGPKDTNKKAFDDFGDFLSKKVWDYAEKNDLMGDNRYSTVEYITSELQDALKGKYSPDDYYGLRTKAGQQLISDVRNEINKLPTDYFELKMNRPVGLKEFSGAILPEGYDDQEVLAALKDAGVEVLGNYDKNNMDATLQDTLKNLTSGKNRFKTPYMLGLAGLLGGGALMANQQKDKEEVR